ncbi:MAG: AIR synthase related protein [Thermomicrobiales bacterium]|nr:AIR synthase related protein [Thermomicrobiales bacterium]
MAEAARNVAATGARPLGLTNCLNFGSPERNPADYQLVKAVKGMGDASRKLGVPIVSGNVSLYNETQQQPVFPTPAIGCVGVLEDVTTAMDMRWQDGETVWLVGQGQPSLGGSEYLAYIHGMTAGRPPAIDLDAEVRLIRFLHAVASARLDAAVHDLSAGGFALGIVEMALTSGIGVTLTDIDTTDRIDTTWFGESAGRVLIAVDASATMQLRRLAEEWELPHQQIGVVGGDAVVLPDGTSVQLSDALAASESALSVGVEAEMA